MILLNLIILAFGVLQIPQVQTKIGQELANFISEKTGYTFQVNKVSIYWFDMADLEQVKIYDTHDDLMIDAENIKVDFRISGFFENPIVLDEVIVYSPKVNLIRNTVDKKLNLDEFIITMRTAFIGKKKKKNPKIKAFMISSGEIVNGHFVYDDRTQEYNPKEQVFDKFHFSFKAINAQIERFYTHLDTFSLNIRDLNTIEEKTTLFFDSLNANMQLTKHELRFDQLRSHVNRSLINGNIAFQYDSIKHMSYFVDSINLEAHVDETIIYTQDLAHFAPELKIFDDRWVITSDFSGRIRNFDLENMHFQFGGNSFLNGHVGLKGLPHLKETLIDIDLVRSSIASTDAKQYIPKDYYSSVQKFGDIQFSGDFFGFANNFVAHGNAQTALGKLYSDLKFVLEENDKKATYTGHLSTFDFELGKFLDRKDVGQISMKGKVKGEGFSVEDAKINIKAHSNKFVYNKYAYKNIDIDALLQNGLFDGVMIVEDPNLDVAANGKIDFRNNRNIFDIYVELDKANLQQLKFTQDSSFFSGQMDLRFKGLSMDEVQGESKLENMLVYYNGQKLQIDNFYFLSTKRDSTRKFIVKSNYFDIEVEGNYDFGSISNQLLLLREEMVLLIENDPEATSNYYSKKGAIKPFNATYEIDLYDINPLLKLFYNDAMVSPNTSLSGNISTGETSIFNLYSKVDSVNIQDFTFRNNLIDISITKDADSSNTLGMIYLNSKQQDFKGAPILNELHFETLIDGDYLGFNLETEDHDSDDFGQFSGSIKLNKNSTKICLNPSRIKVYDNLWESQDSTFINIVNKNIHFDSLDFQSDSQRVLVHGMLSNSSMIPLMVSFENLDLSGKVELPGKLPLEGKLDGNLSITNFYRDITLNGKVNIQNLNIDNIDFGDLKGKVFWEKAQKILETSAEMTLDGKKTLSLKGGYDFKNEQSPLNFKIIINESNFNILEPFLLGNATRFEGVGTGNVSITGDFPQPFFNGEIKIANGAFTLPYFNTRYYFNDKVLFNENKIIVDNLTLYDSLHHHGIDRSGHQAKVNGYIAHNFFDDFKFNVDLDLQKALVLNTHEGQNSLYYGTAVGTGNINIKGPLKEVKIFSEVVRTERPTNITLLSTSTDVTGPFNVEGLRFVAPKDQEKKEEDTKKQSSEISYDVKMSFDITPVAQFKLIYDEEVFEVKKGTGLLEMFYSSKGEFELYNTYTIQEGSYNFKFANLVNKKFIANPGSSITWSGDPYDGKLDVTALYRIQTSLAPILDSNSVDMSNPDTRKSYPVMLLMNIDGKISAPEFTFDIEFEDYPQNMPAKPSGLVSTQNYISQFQNDIHNNEQELNRQVFSLLVLQSLAYKNSYSGSGGAVSGSVNELIANQMSAWLSEVDENLEIDLDLSGMSNEEVKALRMRLTYSILDGRVRITRDGNINTTDNENETNNLIGEWTVEYLITDDGRVRIKAYNKTNQNSTSSSYYSDNSQVYGASVVFSKDFDSLEDLLGLDKKEQKKKNPNKGEPKKSEAIDLKDDDETQD